MFDHPWRSWWPSRKNVAWVNADNVTRFIMFFCSRGVVVSMNSRKPMFDVSVCLMFTPPYGEYFRFGMSYISFSWIKQDPPNLCKIATAELARSFEHLKNEQRIPSAFGPFIPGEGKSFRLRRPTHIWLLQQHHWGAGKKKSIRWLTWDDMGAGDIKFQKEIGNLNVFRS